MLNMFLDIVSETPQCLVWLPLMHRMANVEHGKGATVRVLSHLSLSQPFNIFVRQETKACAVEFR